MDVSSGNLLNVMHRCLLSYKSCGGFPIRFADGVGHALAKGTRVVLSLD